MSVELGKFQWGIRYPAAPEGHHCGFDFAENQPTAKCKCGAVATNPAFFIKGEQK